MALREAVNRVRHQAGVLEGWRFPGPRRRPRRAPPPVGAARDGKDPHRRGPGGRAGRGPPGGGRSRLVSKWIGETEKNLARAFEAAERSQAVLLFDEADALFARRTEVSDANARYANLETAYLLTRLERFDGLAVLATNLRRNVDSAFLRRMEFVVDYLLPNAAERRDLWARMFPPTTPTDGLRPEVLARLVVAGGVIRNIAVAATFLAAAEGGPVTMDRLARAARRECTKLDRPLSAAEVGEWR